MVVPVFLIMIVGLLIFALSRNPNNPNNADIKRIGEIMFFCGLLALCFAGDKVIDYLHRIGG